MTLHSKLWLIPLLLPLALGSACSGLGSVFPPDAGNGGDDDVQDAPLFPLQTGTVLTYQAAIGYGDVTATGTLTVSHVGDVNDDGQSYFMVQREFVASEAGADDPADYAFTEERYYDRSGGQIALKKAVVTYPNGTTATSVYDPADLRFDRKGTIELDHDWSTLGQVAIIVEQDDGTRNEQTLDHRSYYQVTSSGERELLGESQVGFTITGTHHYGDEAVQIETFCAPDQFIGYQAITPQGQVGRPVTQELTGVQEG